MKRFCLVIAFLSSFLLRAQGSISLEEIQIPPAFKDCKGVTEDDLRACFYREFTTYIQENLVYPPEAILKRLNSRVYTSFVIDEKGKVVNVMARGEYASLEEEAIRLITELPKFKPGEQDGNRVSTHVTLPILFSMPPGMRTGTGASPRPEQFNDSVANTLEKVPVFPGCEGLSDQESRACFHTRIREHIAKNFRYPRMAQLKNIQGTVYANFIINTDGSISDINLIAPHQLLADETIRIIELLPEITPGTQRGKAVRVPYSIPITFRLLSPKR